MPWWLRRIERGGDVLAPGPPDLPLQYIDCRDLAAWLLHAAEAGIGGIFNTVSEPGHATMRSLLEAAKMATGSAARLVWVPPEVIGRVDIEPWTELPIWVPPDSELAGLHTGNVSAVYEAGLSCRPIEDTVADTWAWLQAEGDPPPRPGRAAHGLDPEREQQALDIAASSRSSASGRADDCRAMINYPPLARQVCACGRSVLTWHLISDDNEHIFLTGRQCG